MIKWNWGTGIFAFIVFFVLAMAFLVWISFQQKINLVTPDYYPKGISYDSQMEKEKNTSALDEKLKISQDENFLKVSFPELAEEEKFSGKITLFRPSDYEEDKFIDISLNDSLTQVISKENLLKGQYVIKIDWELEEKKYYQQKIIVVK